MIYEVLEIILTGDTHIHPNHLVHGKYDIRYASIPHLWLKQVLPLLFSVLINTYIRPLLSTILNLIPVPVAETKT